MNIIQLIYLIIILIHVDEAHFIHTAGLALYGSKAFWPSWAQLDELKAILPRIPWQAISATFPSHILKTVETKILRMNYVCIRISSNWPNTMYATHCVVSSIEKPCNYERFLLQPFNFASHPRVLIFFDNIELASTIAAHLDGKLPEEFHGKGIVLHYHIGMSEQHLRAAHSAFTEEAGSCKINPTCHVRRVSHEFICQILFSQIKIFAGVDFPDVKIVCNAGLPSNIVE